MRIKLTGIAVGQGLSVMNTLLGICSKYLFILGLDTPMFQLVWTYALLASVYAGVLFYKKLHPPARHIWKYAVAALTDSQGNFFVYLAFDLTSVLSAFCLMNSSVIMVMALSYLFLKKRFSLFELVGSLVCLIGVVLIVVSDLKDSGWQFEGDFLGDMSVLLGTFLYCVQEVFRTNIIEEYLMTHGHQPNGYICYLGCFGTLIAIVLSLATEFPGIQSIDNGYQIMCYIGFAFSLFGMYSISPYYFRNYGAVMYNLSLLTSTVYGVVLAVVLFDDTITWLYGLGFVFMMIGVLLYNYQRPRGKEESMLDEELNTQENIGVQ